jgi:hypothetical protein
MDPEIPKPRVFTDSSIVNRSVHVYAIMGEHNRRPTALKSSEICFGLGKHVLGVALKNHDINPVDFLDLQSQIGQNLGIDPHSRPSPSS